jgi:hypothetical protein
MPNELHKQTLDWLQIVENPRWHMPSACCDGLPALDAGMNEATGHDKQSAENEDKAEE